MSRTQPIPAEGTKTVHILREEFADSLVAVYLHGSAVAGGLRPDSDVDVLAVISRPMTDEVGIRLRDTMLRISGRPSAGIPRPIELIVFFSEDLTAAVYPARCEFMYGEWLRHGFEAGETPQPICDPELTLVLAQAWREAVPLAGPEANALLPRIAHMDVRRAIGDMLPALMNSLEGDERNVLLTLARMWSTVTDGDFVSKDVAATWAAARLTGGPAAMLLQARDAYLGSCVEDWRTRREDVRRTAVLLHKAVVSALSLAP